MRKVSTSTASVGEYLEVEAEDYRPTGHPDDPRGGFQGNNDFTIIDSMTNGNVFDVDSGKEFTGHANGAFNKDAG